MILTTTNSIEGFKIIEYKGIVSGVGLNSQKAAMALKDNAKGLNANAVVGIKVDIELTTANYVMVSVTGTAVNVAV